MGPVKFGFSFGPSKLGNYPLHDQNAALPNCKEKVVVLLVPIFTTPMQRNKQAAPIPYKRRTYAKN